MARLLKSYNNDFKACSMGVDLPSLDFAGFSALVGANATKAGIPYTCLIRSHVPYVNAYVSVGTYGLAQAVLSCINWRPARILMGNGDAGSMLALCGLKASGNAMYVGLQSATGKLPVRGAVGEAVVLELLRRGKEFDCPLIGRDARRPTWVVTANINQPDIIDGEVCVVGDHGALINYLATIACAIVLELLVMCHEWFAFALIFTGMLLNATMAFLLREQRFVLPPAKPAESAPPGDAVIVVNDDPDVFCMLRGTEKAIQRLLQKEVKLEAEWVERLPLFLVSVAFMVYSAVLVLGVPNMRATAQWLFLFVVCFGSMIDLIKGSWNGKRGIAKEAIEKYGIEIEGVKKFGNRTAAIVCVASGSTRLDTLKAASLCPTEGVVWENWWTVLEEILRTRAVDESQVQAVQAMQDAVYPTIQRECSEDDIRLWNILRTDMLHGLVSLMGVDMQQYYSTNLEHAQQQ